MLVDSMLKFLAEGGFEALELVAGQPPVLLKQGARQPLSMPPLDPDVVAMVLEEITSPTERERLQRQGAFSTSYRGPSGTFVAEAEQVGRGARLVFRKVDVRRGAATVELPRLDPLGPREGAPVREPVPTPTRTLAAVGTPVAGAIERVLARAELEHASDVLFSSGRNAWLRVGGDVVEVADSACDDAMLVELCTAGLDERARERLESEGSIDVALALSGGRWRANLFRRHGGLALALRPIRTSAPTLRELDLPDDLHEIVQHRSGLVLVTGQTGAGKSTTLIALVEHLNRTAPRHLLTLEDPIEYEFSPQRALVHQREIGRDVDDFATGLRAALRESPDVIMLGEMRDPATIAAALTAAETGHLVLSTLHAGGAASAIDRMIDAFPAHQQTQVRMQLASVLRAIVTQVLVPTTRPPARVPAIEKLVINTAVASKIRESRGHQIQSEIQKGRADGMISLEASLGRWVKLGRVSAQVAAQYVADPALLRELSR